MVPAIVIVLLWTGWIGATGTNTQSKKAFTVLFFNDLHGFLTPCPFSFPVGCYFK